MLHSALSEIVSLAFYPFASLSRFTLVNYLQIGSLVKMITDNSCKKIKSLSGGLVKVLNFPIFD